MNSSGLALAEGQVVFQTIQRWEIETNADFSPMEASGCQAFSEKRWLPRLQVGAQDSHIKSPISEGPYSISEFSSVQSLSHVQLFVTPWITARQVSQSITNSWSSLKLMSIESVMPSSHLILCRPLLLLPLIPPRIRVFSNESTLRIRWPKY